MRRGQRAQAAREVVLDGDRVLVTARFAAQLTGRPLRTIQDRPDAVACDVATGALYWDGKALGVQLDAVIPRQRRSNLRRSGSVSNSTPPPRVVT